MPSRDKNNRANKRNVNEEKLLTALFLEEDMFVEVRHQLLKTIAEHDIRVTSQTDHAPAGGKCNKRLSQLSSASNRQPGTHGSQRLMLLLLLLMSAMT